MPSVAASFANRDSISSSPSASAKYHVHPRARFLLDRTLIQTARIDRFVEQPGFCFVAPFERARAAFALEPFEHQGQHVNSERGRRVEERMFFDLRAILQQGRQLGIGALGQVFANNYNCRARLLLNSSARPRKSPRIAAHSSGAKEYRTTYPPPAARRRFSASFSTACPRSCCSSTCRRKKRRMRDQFRSRAGCG